MATRILDTQIASGIATYVLEDQVATSEAYVVTPTRLFVIKDESRITAIKPDNRIINV